MNRIIVAMSRPEGLLQWLRIYRLYRASFPLIERKPFRRIINMYRKGKTDVWYFQKDGRFAAFAITINGDDNILLDYLAVAEDRREEGIGSAVLQLLREHYPGKGLFLEIESAFDDAENSAERKRRRNFYISNGMRSMKVMVNLFGVKMELLGFDCDLDYEGYHYFYTHNYGEWTGPHITEADCPDSWEI